MELYRVMGFDLSPQVFAPINERSIVEEYQCDDCGFTFFDPSLAGSDSFYEALRGYGYYVADRPEFQFALNYLDGKPGFKNVVDVGSGDGAFLDLAAERSYKVTGVELNPLAANEARVRNHTVICKPLGEISGADIDLPIDAITMFHVLEHVPDPIGFTTEAAALLRSGGVLIVAVPNHDGLFRVHPYDPKNLPPHHISRWRRRDFGTLAESCGLTLKTVTGDPLYGRGLLEFWLQHNRLARAIGRNARPGGALTARLICYLYRKCGVRYLLPPWGLSTYAVFEKE